MSQCTCFVLIITSSAKCNWHSSYIEISESSRARLAPHNIMILHACVMTLKNFFLLHVLIIKLIGIAEGAVILLPSGQAPVCHSEQLQLICNTTELYRYLRWSYSVYNEQGVLTDYTRTVSSIDASQQSSHIVVNSTSFNFLRISGQGVPPITTMTINSVGNSLNGITVGCTGMGNLEMMTARTTISIINETYQEPQVYSRAQFGTDNATVTLELAANQETGVVYNVSVVPQVDFEFIHSTVAQLRVAYNVMYNVSIVRTLCGRYSTTTNLKLSYAKCGYPLVADNSLRTTGYHNPALEGATITFSCPPGKILTGPNMTTCMENGEWEPDPQIEGIKCAADYGPPFILVNEDGQVYLDNTTIDGARVLFICSNDVEHSFEQAHAAVCNPQELNWWPNPANLYSGSKITGTCDRLTTALVSSATVFLITSIVSVFIGFLCGRLVPRKNRRPPLLEYQCKSACNHQLSHTSTGHVYETVTPEMIANYFPNQEQKVDLKENVAYEFVQPKTTSKFVVTA